MFGQCAPKRISAVLLSEWAFTRREAAEELSRRESGLVALPRRLPELIIHVDWR